MASDVRTRHYSPVRLARLRRNRLRRMLLENLETRTLMAFDALNPSDLQPVIVANPTFGSLWRDSSHTSIASLSEAKYSTEMSDVLDSAYGDAAGGLVNRPWFPLVESAYRQWSEEQGLAFSYFTQTGLKAEGEGLRGEGEAGGPRLLSIAPNSGDIFTFNGVNQLTDAPTELVFRFDGSGDISQPTLAGGIRITRAGGDNAFGNSNDQIIAPGFLGFGDNNRIVIARFASTLPDDLYRVEVMGTDIAAQGITAIRNAANLRLTPRFGNTDRDIIQFNLELGAQVVAVVPQPVERKGDGSLDPKLKEIHVYFNNDDLYPSAVETGAITPNPTVVDPVFYQLILTKDTVQPHDDVVFRPTKIKYDPALDRAILEFASDIDVLAAGAGTFRLRVGSSDNVASAANPPVVTSVNPSTDPAGFLSGAFDLGAINAATSRIVTEQVVTVSNPLALDYPGSNNEPGHRDIQDENHLGRPVDSDPNITTAQFNFALDRSYGVNSLNQPVFTSITTDQIQRVREIFEFYSAQLGIDFVETASSGMTVVVGDMAPNGEVSAPGGVAGVASLNNIGSGLAIMDGAELWDNSLGGSFFNTALHEIGHMLGLGHAYELPTGTVMGGSPTDFIFPGDHDVTHGRHLYRPDNRDVDLYRFQIPAGVTGDVTIEAVAERLANSSNLDSHLTLLRQTATGLEVVSVNDDYFSSDSLIRAKLSPGVYFVGMTSSGNGDYNALTGDTGAGGVSQGSYQLRFDFVPAVATSIVDTTGTSLDGDGDNQAGGNFNFWFRAATPTGAAAAGAPKTIYVDKGYVGTQSGSPTQPFNSLPAAAAVAAPGDILRVAGSIGADKNLATTADNPAYEIGRGGVGNAALSDGVSFEIPRGVTMMIDAGAIIKTRGSRIVAGSRDAGIDNRLSSIQVLGTPQRSVLFTSYNDESLGIDTNPLVTTPRAGDWGGIEIHNDVDRAEGRGDYERAGIFLNYISNADMKYGGGQITVTNPSPTVSSIHLSEARATLINNRIQFASDSAISADPNSFEETLFTEPRYQIAGAYRPDYDRVGPEIRGNLVTSNTLNGLFVRIATAPGGLLQTLDLAARFDDVDITHILGENLIIAGTPGGSYLETVAPDVSRIQFQDATGGTLTVGSTFRYRVTFVDRFGGESISSALSPVATVPAGRAVLINNLPAATGDFVGRRLWRSMPGGGGSFTLVAELDGDTTSYTDLGANLNVLLTNTGASIQRARPDARLAIDPGIVVKSLGSRIEVGIGAQIIAEGTPEKKVVLTSRFDDRYGAGGTFDSNNDGLASSPAAGNWGGIIARHMSSLSIDSALVTYAGGLTSLPGGAAGFNAVELHQASGRIARSTFENNGNGLGGNLPLRDGRANNDASVIYVRASQPVIIDNIFRNNSTAGTAVISIDANAMKAEPIQDQGRQTGENERRPGSLGNMGPLVRGNRLGGNGLNGLRVRGATLTTDSVWDDTDIVHVLQSEIVVPNFHTYGGLRLQSRVDESLVIKLGAGAGITASGAPLDITDRIGGSVQVVGTPGFPVVLTSIKDDTVGAGFGPNGQALLDTDNVASSPTAADAWRSIRLESYSNDRNLDTVIELESDQIQDVGVNDDSLSAQFLGTLAASTHGGDENLRLGFTVAGAVASTSDLDVYNFVGAAGAQVWIDLDRTDAALDSVVELIDANGNILAQSNNSLAESIAKAPLYVNTSLISANNVNVLDASPFAARNSLSNAAVDFQSTSPLDAGMRVILPGAPGTQNSYFVRVRSSNVAPGQSTNRLQNPSELRSGLTTGAYRMQLRLQQEDEIAGSTIRYADIRFATNGVETLGVPSHSPLLGNGVEQENGSQTPGTDLNFGNLATTDRASGSASGNLSANDVDYYQFSIRRESIQIPGNLHIGTTFDIDYASGYGGPNTSLWVYRQDAAGIRLVLVGSDSNVADDRSAPMQNSDLDDLSRGSFGALDAFIGTQELPDGNYIVAVTAHSRIADQLRQFQVANPPNANVRLEPLDSVRRIVVDRFRDEQGNFSNTTYPETALPPLQVAFDGNNLSAVNSVPWTLADVTAYAVRDNGSNSELLFFNAMTGAQEALVATGDANTATFAQVKDIAVAPDGRVAAFVIPTGAATDANSGQFVILDSTGVGGLVNAGNSGIQTLTAEDTTGAGTTFAIRQRNNTGDGIQFQALAFYSQTSTTALQLWGVGSRGNIPGTGATFNVGVVANNAVTGIGPSSSFTTNIIYKLDPATGAAINPAGAADRTTTAVLTGAGTNKVEFGRFISTGTITGLADVGANLYAVSDLGELFTVAVGAGNNAFSNTINPLTTIRDGGTAIRFTALTPGPRNLEGGRYANLLFGSTANGTVYAFDTAGVLQNIFPGGTFKTESAAAPMSNVRGIGFSPLDVNLWHLTETQSAAAGHGRSATFDRSRPVDRAGGTSLYFGFENPGRTAQQGKQDGDWSGIYDVAAYRDSFNLPGGAHGAIESRPIDLRGYSSEDMPTLYFNYNLSTENRNSPLDDNDIRMRDAFRVYAAGDDGRWILLVTNNSASNGNFADFNDELDVNISRMRDPFNRPLAVQEAFDAGDNGAPDAWRQARASLAPLAGNKNVRIRFEFSSGASFRTGDALRGGVELAAVEGSRIADGDTFSISTVDQSPAITRTFEFDVTGNGVTPGNVAVSVTQNMTSVQVRDAIRSALAQTFNAAGQGTNLSVWPVYGQTIRMFKYDVVSAGPLSVSSRTGDQFGVQLSGNNFTRMDERAQNNTGRGVFIDDIIVGLAERGEMVINSSVAAPAFLPNLQYEPSGFAIEEIEEGRYQLEIRTSADYGHTLKDEILRVPPVYQFPPNESLILGSSYIQYPSRVFDSNDRLSQQISLDVNALGAAGIADGTVLTLSDGYSQVNFEFDLGVGGTTAGNIPISLVSTDDAARVATKIRNVINSPTAQSLFKISASVNGEMLAAANVDQRPSNSSRVILHGPAALSRSGDFTFTGTGLTIVRQGTESGFGEDQGDSNRRRDQGVVVISSSTIRDGQQFGILVDAVRDAGGVTRPGAPINYPTANADRLAPGVVIVNNILSSNAQGGVRISGDPAQGSASTVARIINNTIFGRKAGNDRGILVDDGASPTIINNILSRSTTGIDVAAAGSRYVISANFYFDNSADLNPTSAIQSFSSTSTTSPFVDSSTGRFYPVAGAPVIDSSLESLGELASLTQLKNALGLPPSPAFAPDTDVTGQRRVDDPTVNSPAGLGANVFKDRGAIDRADFFGPQAVMLGPLDNDSSNLDVDKSDTYIRLKEGTLDFFSILLLETQGTGPDASSVNENSVTLTENGKFLQPRVDYVFGFNANSRTIRLTPLAGIWRNDSIYEITLSNRDGIRLTVPNGASLADGNKLTVKIPGVATDRVLEFDKQPAGVSAGAVAIPITDTSTSFQVSSQLVAALNGLGNGVSAYLQADGSVIVYGATSIASTPATAITTTAFTGVRDLATNPLQPNRPNSLTQFTILMPEVPLDFGDALSAASPTLQASDGARHAILPVDVPRLVLGSLIDGDADGQPSSASVGDDIDASVSVGVAGSIPVTLATTGPFVLSVPAFTAALEGQQIKITDPNLPNPAQMDVFFEFTTDATLINSNANPVTVTATSTAAQVATALANAVNNAVQQNKLLRTTAGADGGTVSIYGDALHVIDLSAAAGVTRRAVGNVNLVVPNSIASFADSQTLIIQDGDSRAVTFELNNSNASNPNQGVQPGNVAINIDLATATSASLAQALASTINGQIAARNLTLGNVSVSGSTLSIVADDEDGVQFGANFKANAPAVPVTVTSSGTAVLDAWIDWNRDGDFNDGGEQVITSKFIPAGATTFDINTPVNASVGPASSRFRLSNAVTLGPSGLAIGGEVEDHMVIIEQGGPLVNDPPEFTLPIPPVARGFEDQGLVTVPAFVTGIRPGPINAFDEVNQKLTMTIQADPAAFITLPTIDLATGDLKFQTGKDVNRLSGHNLQVVVTIQDDGGTAGGGIDSNSKTFTLDIEPVNDEPSFTLPSVTASVFEDNETVIGAAQTVVANFATKISAGPATAVDETTSATSKQSVSFVTVSVSDASLFLPTGQPGIASDGSLRFRTAPDKSGSAVVVVKLTDSGQAPTTPPTLPHDNESGEQTFTITLQPVNDPPAFVIPMTTNSSEDQGVVVVPGFASNIVTGPATATDEISQKITFTLTASDPSAFAVQPTIDATGALRYQTGKDVNSNNKVLTVTALAADSGSGTPAPNNNKSDVKTFTIVVASVNDAPVLTLPNVNPTVDEDSPLATFTGFATNLAAAGGLLTAPQTATDEAGQSLSFNIVSVSAPELFEVQPSLSNLGVLTFKPLANRNGKAVVIAQLVDNGPSAPVPNENASARATFTISINAINDAPQFDIPTTLTVNEDQGLASISNFATNIRRGPVGAEDENSQLVTFAVSASDPSAFDIQPRIEVDGTLSFRTASNVNSLNNSSLTVRVQLSDNGPNSPVPNSNQSSIKTFTLTVNPENDPPIANSFTATTVEDSPVVIQASDVLVGDVGGPTSDELGQTLRITQVEPLSARGGTIAVTSSNGTITAITYTPLENLFGTDTFLYVMTDNGNPNRSGTGTITINLTGLNDPPEFVKGPDQVSLEDAGPISVANWATNIMAGPVSAGDENQSQSVSFEISVDQPSLFEQLPTVSSAGTLQYKSAKDASGVATVTVTAVDNGSNVAPNRNRSIPATFKITVTARNDAPVFTPGSNVSVAEDSAPYSQAWATNVVPAAGLRSTPPTAQDESGQNVAFDVSADKASLFSVQPAISSSGILSFTVAPDATGQAVLSVLARDNGPSGPNDENASGNVLLTITITPTNDAPVGVNDTFAASENDVLRINAPGILVNDTDVDLANDKLFAVGGTVVSSQGASVSISDDGSFTYDPTNVTVLQRLSGGQSAIDTFTYRVRDNANLQRGLATVTINVAGVNDAPVANNDRFSVGVSQAQSLTILANDTDIDSPIDVRSIVIGSLPTFGVLSVNQNGTVDYVPSPGFRGTDTFTYTVRDTAGVISNEASVIVDVNSSPVAGNDSVVTFKNKAVDISVLQNDSDVDGSLNVSSVQVVAGPTPSGTVQVLADGKIRFTPATDFFGAAQFSYVVADDLGATSNPATVQIQVQRSLWMNPQIGLDVNADGFVSPIDALEIINYLNSGRPSSLPSSNVVPPPFLDTNGDEFVTPIDALLIVNFLNTQALGEGEGLSQVDVNMVTPADMLATVGPGIVRQTLDILDEVRLAVLPEQFASDDDETDIHLFASHIVRQHPDDIGATHFSPPQSNEIDAVLGDLFSEPKE